MTQGQCNEGSEGGASQLLSLFETAMKESLVLTLPSFGMQPAAALVRLSLGQMCESSIRS
jgi:hypothetical protein